MSVGPVLATIALILCCIASIVILIHTIYAFFVAKTVTSSTMMKYVVLITLILLTSDTMIHTIYKILGISSYKFSTISCKMQLIVLSVAYYSAKAFLFNFYTLRAYLAFKDSAIEYKKTTIMIALILINILSLISVIGWISFELPLTSTSIDSNGNYYCIVTASTEENYSYNQILTYFIVYSTLIEVILSVGTLWLFLNKLSKMSFSIFIARKQSFAQKKLSANINIDDDQELEELDYNNPNHIELWHNKTESVNFMLLIVTKLLILQVIIFITTMIATILFLTAFDRIYAVDSAMNGLCVYFSFEFSTNIWTKLFCGNQCVSVSFPLVKMWTLSPCLKKQNGKCKCSIYDKKQKNMHKMIKNEYDLYLNVKTPNNRQQCACCWKILEKELEKDQEIDQDKRYQLMTT